MDLAALVGTLFGRPPSPSGRPPSPSGRPPSPSGETPIPIGETPIPIGETPIPAGETPIPVGETPIPVGETPIPIGETPIPAGETPIPAGETPIPVGETPIPVGETPIPLGGTPLPTRGRGPFSPGRASHPPISGRSLRLRSVLLRPSNGPEASPRRMQRPTQEMLRRSPILLRLMDLSGPPGPATGDPVLHSRHLTAIALQITSLSQQMTRRPNGVMRAVRLPPRGAQQPLGDSHHQRDWSTSPTRREARPFGD
jgi:hypothetical protein